jgi:hypothetical protein
MFPIGFDGFRGMSKTTFLNLGTVSLCPEMMKTILGKGNPGKHFWGNRKNRKVLP